MTTVLVRARVADFRGRKVDRKKEHTGKVAVRDKPPLESQIQCDLVSWARASAYHQLDPDKKDALEFFYSIPNGAKLMGQRPINPRTGKRRPPREAEKLIAEGLVTGEEDLVLDWPLRDERGLITCPGLRLEMKRPGEKPTAKQLRLHEFHRRMGWRVEVHESARTAALVVIRHMKLTRYDPLPVDRWPPRKAKR